MARYLLQQWTSDTIRNEDRKEKSHGLPLWATPSSSSRLLEVAEDDIILIAGVLDGCLLPICALTVGRTATRQQLISEGEDPYDLPYFAVAKPPTSRMNLRHAAGRQLSQSITKADGRKLTRRKREPSHIDGQSFRYPQWLEPESAKRLIRFLDDVWDAEDDAGLHDPQRVSRGLAPRLTVAERRAVELRAMKIVAAKYRKDGYTLADVSATEPWDLTARSRGEEWHIEVKGTTGEGKAVTVTAGERRHADEAIRPAFAIVSEIKLSRGRDPTASGGTLSVHLKPWDTAKGRWSATVYRYEPAN